MASIIKRDTPQGMTYQVRVRVRGFPTQTKTFVKLADAKHWAQQTQSEVKNGLFLKRSPAMKHTFAEMIDRYVAEVLCRKANNDGYSAFSLDANYQTSRPSIAGGLARRN